MKRVLERGHYFEIFSDLTAFWKIMRNSSIQTMPKASKNDFWATEGSEVVTEASSRSPSAGVRLVRILFTWALKSSAISKVSEAAPSCGWVGEIQQQAYSLESSC